MTSCLMKLCPLKKCGIPLSLMKFGTFQTDWVECSRCYTYCNPSTPYFTGIKSFFCLKLLRLSTILLLWIFVRMAKYSDCEIFAKHNLKKSQIWEICPLKMEMHHFSKEGNFYKLFQLENGSAPWRHERI